jgi:hypothetical protein
MMKFKLITLLFLSLQFAGYAQTASSEKNLFGGCMLKDAQSKGLGNLSDAVVEDWPKTIKKVIAKFPTAEIVIQWHGQTGEKDVLTHTLKFFINKHFIE